MFALLPLKKEYKKLFITDMQEAFQTGAEQEFGKTDEIILPEEDIERCLAEKDAAAYQAVLDGKTVGGAVVIIDEETKHNHLAFLYVKTECQGKGIGKKIWSTLEKLYPDTLIWETVTPYFEKRNLHFYINQCGFHAVEFYNPRHKDPNAPDSLSEDECLFRFEKHMPQ